MAFFEDLKKSFSDVSETIAKKSGEIVEVQKLKMKKSGLESDIKKNYIQLGRIYFHQMEESGVIDEVSEEFFQSIVEAKEAIEEIKVKLEEMSKEKVCAVCGEKSPKGMAFCPHCGTKFEDEEDTGADDNEEDEKSVCRKAEEAVKEACEKAGEAAESACERAEEAAENVRERAEEAAENVRERAEEAAENVREKAAEAAVNVCEKVKDAAENVYEKAKEVSEKSEEDK